MKWLAYLKKAFRIRGIQPHSKNQPKAVSDEWDLYSLNRYQLKNLLDKKIQFGFFQMEDCPLPCGEEISWFLQKAQRKTKEELLSGLKDQDSEQPLVLICSEGLISKELSQNLRSQGFINVYFVDGGWKGLLNSKD